MSDLKERMQSLDLLDPPELWHRVGARHVELPREPRRGKVVAAVMLLAALAIAVLVRLSYRDSASEPIRPGPRPNGPIYFVSEADRITGSVGFYVVNEDGTGFKKLPAPTRSFGQMAVSPDGNHVAFATGGFDVTSDVFIMRSDGTNVRRLTSDEPTGFLRGAHDNAPAWSPDGKRLAFASTRCCDKPGSMGNRALYVMRADGSGAKQITDGAIHVWEIAWAPDGKSIAFTGLSGPIYLVEPDGSNLRTIGGVDGRFIKDLAWSPDGTQIVYATEGRDPEGPTKWGSVPQDYQIRTINRDGTGETTIYRCDGLCRFSGYGVEWSPDGKRIAFLFGRVHGVGIDWFIGLVAPDGSGFRFLQTYKIQVRDFTWAAR
jgi:Tol biopolymer transport system component